MIDLIRYPLREEWAPLMRRAVSETAQLHDSVAAIIEAVQKDGDAALRAFAEKFDHVVLTDLRVSEVEMEEAKCALSDELKAAIDVAAENIACFHQAQNLHIYESAIRHRNPKCTGTYSFHKYNPFRSTSIILSVITSV